MDDYEYLNPIHDRLKTILDDLVVFAQKANVEYSLAYGTLLGACRHKDIIPWDDDVDVVMKRDDYEKFVEFFKTNNMGNYILSSIDTDGSCSLYAKLVRTSGDEELAQYFTHPRGLCIDIFPLDDAYSQKNLFQRINEIRVRSLKTIVSSRIKMRDRSFREKKLKRITRRLIVTPFFMFSDKKLMNKAIRLCSKYRGKNTSDFVYYGTIYPMKNEHNKKEYWFPLTKLPLGKNEYNVPRNYKAVLTTYYGKDYYKMPPDYVKTQHINNGPSGWNKSN